MCNIKSLFVHNSVETDIDFIQDVHRKKIRFGRFANVFQRKQSHKVGQAY